MGNGKSRRVGRAFETCPSSSAKRLPTCSLHGDGLHNKIEVLKTTQLSL